MSVGGAYAGIAGVLKVTEACRNEKKPRPLPKRSAKTSRRGHWHDEDTRGRNWQPGQWRQPHRRGETVATLQPGSAGPSMHCSVCCCSPSCRALATPTASPSCPRHERFSGCECPPNWVSRTARARRKLGTCLTRCPLTVLPTTSAMDSWCWRISTPPPRSPRCEIVWPKWSMPSTRQRLAPCSPPPITPTPRTTTSLPRATRCASSTKKVCWTARATSPWTSRWATPCTILDPVFDQFSRAPQVKQLIADLELANPLMLQSMYIFKQPRIGGEVTWHCDHSFLWTEPQTTVGLWIALEDATLDNGCLWAVPGGHISQPPKTRFHREGAGTAMDVMDPTPYVTSAKVALPVKAGTLIVLHSSLPHWSAPNTTDVSRHAYTLHVIDGGANYPGSTPPLAPPAGPASAASEFRSGRPLAVRHRDNQVVGFDIAGAEAGNPPTRPPRRLPYCGAERLGHGMRIIDDIDTSGDEPQLGRLAAFDEDTYRKELDTHVVETDGFVMVGNSVPSDVLPVVNIGGHGVHIPYHITWEHETDDFPAFYLRHQRAACPPSGGHARRGCRSSRSRTRRWLQRRRAGGQSTACRGRARCRRGTPGIAQPPQCLRPHLPSPACRGTCGSPPPLPGERIGHLVGTNQAIDQERTNLVAGQRTPAVIGRRVGDRYGQTVGIGIVRNDEVAADLVGQGKSKIQGSGFFRVGECNRGERGVGLLLASHHMWLGQTSTGESRQQQLGAHPVQRRVHNTDALLVVSGAAANRDDRGQVVGYKRRRSILDRAALDPAPGPRTRISPATMRRRVTRFIRFGPAPSGPRIPEVPKAILEPKRSLSSSWASMDKSSSSSALKLSDKVNDTLVPASTAGIDGLPDCLLGYIDIPDVALAVQDLRTGDQISVDLGRVEQAADTQEGVHAGDLEPAENAHHRRVWSLGESGRIQASPHALDLERVRVFHQPFKHIGDHRLHRVRMERDRIHLAIARTTGVGDELHEDEVPPAIARWRVANNERLNIDKLHGPSMSLLSGML
ncbi:Phytanoyl-CoA dioxygenase 2 [Nymphon striatum]|nr:Phytanoyl-CoA dioxygenase 2 [Nymphon striatum]